MPSTVHTSLARLSLIAASASWGIATVLSKDLVLSFSPLMILAIQLAVGAGLTWAMVIVRGPRHISLADLATASGLGVLNPGLAGILNILGLYHAEASLVSVLWAVESIFIVFLAVWCLQESVSRVQLWASLAAVIAVAVVTLSPGTSVSLAASGYGAILVLVAVLAYAIFVVLSRSLLAASDPLISVALQQSVALAWVLAMLPLHWSDPGLADLAALSSGEWLLCVASGILEFALGAWLFLHGLRHTPAASAAAYLSLTSVFGVAAAYALLGERLTVSQTIAAIVLLVSVTSPLKFPLKLVKLSS